MWEARLHDRGLVQLGYRSGHVIASAYREEAGKSQRRGIGSALVRAGLELARHRDWRAVIVLGHKDYYPRFGFSAALAHPLKAPFSGDAFMALELAPGALQGADGRVTYPPAFGVTNA